MESALFVCSDDPKFEVAKGLRIQRLTHPKKMVLLEKRSHLVMCCIHSHERQQRRHHCSWNNGAPLPQADSFVPDSAHNLQCAPSCLVSLSLAQNQFAFVAQFETCNHIQGLFRVVLDLDILPFSLSNSGSSRTSYRQSTSNCLAFL
eukprot:c22592_g1_i1.p1 GENE.c22592_g1_i1~~c22592_g1_i1.p1  ORF type:complete len:147 (+),score=27.43 c22592_g1_i1:131-571(+)